MITVKEFAKDIDTQLKPLPNELKKKGHLRKLLGKYYMSMNFI